MRRFRRGAALLVCAAVLAGALTTLASSAATGVNLMAVNDRVLDVTVENMPRTVGGVLYVPYTMLSYQATGISLGVNAMYSITRRTVLVTDGQRGVTFDTQNNTAVDMDGVPVSARAMVRNATVFLPVDWLCDYFGTISCTRTATPHGTLIRVTSSAAVLSDRVFVGAADAQLASALRRYHESDVQPPASQPPASQTSDPQPSASAQATPAPGGGSLYLACRGGAQAGDCAQLLEGRGLRGLFLFAPEEIPGQDGLIRRLVGAGHTVGLALEGSAPEDCLAQLEEGRRLLAAAARCYALIAAAPGLDQEGRKLLEAAGAVLWTPTALGEDYASGAALARALSPRRMNLVEVDGDPSFLRAALNAMEEEGCSIYQPTAPALAG